ncbi:MAG: hypothetical protein U1C19_03210 [Methanobacteriaceae archaeon]|nr:hypothetical protein [Methanobacteriaceae archaeon]
MRFRNYIFIAMVLLVFAIAISFVVVNLSTHTELGSDDRGYVTKDVYNHYGESKIKIAIVTGIHPRESISIVPEQWSAKVFALLTPVEIINYNIVVQKNPQHYTMGRNNGEGLAADYILPDVKKSDYNLVIISHAHQEGYGDGYYVATPQMDNPSVSIAQSIKSSSYNFNYYPASKKVKYKSSSALLFSKPLALAGYPTLVYEIPENITSLESFLRTYDLLKLSNEILNS